MLAVVGVGAIGGVVAAELVSAGHSTVGCVRRPFETLRLEAGDRVLRVELSLHTPPILDPPAAIDWILLTTKALQTREAMAWFDAWATENTRLAVLQNGVEQIERVSGWVGASRVVPVVVGCPATAVAPGQIVQRAPARLWVPDDTNGRDFAALFRNTAVNVEATSDWLTAAWRKLCLNVIGGAIAALAGRPMPEVVAPEKQNLALALASECALVARAEGADLSDEMARQLAVSQAEATSGGNPSTLTDRLAGRPLEADARNGAVERIGARHGIATPVNALAASLMSRAHEDPRRNWLPELSRALTAG